MNHSQTFLDPPARRKSGQTGFGRALTTLVLIVAMMASFVGIQVAGEKKAGATTRCGSAPQPSVLWFNCDLSDRDLTNANLTNASLVGANLSNTNLTGATLEGVMTGGVDGTPSALPKGWKLVKGYLVGPKAYLSSADLRNANLTGANLTGANLTNADLSGATLTNTNLTNANLDGATLTDANLTGATLDGVRSGGVHGTHIALPTGWTTANGYLVGPNATLTDADLTGASLNNADLAGADLSGATLTNAHLSGATVTDADLTGAVLAGTMLAGADLTGATLISASLRNATLTNTILTDANLNGVRSGGIKGVPSALPPGWTVVKGYLIGSGADLTGADLANATLTNVDLTNVTLTNVTSGGIIGVPLGLPDGYHLVNGYLLGSDVDLSNADLSGADLSGADLVGATLLRSNLSNANLSGADLSGAVFASTNLTNADLSGANFKDATLTDANFTGAKLTGGVQSGGIHGTPRTLPFPWRVEKGYLIGPEADLRAALLMDADLSYAYLTGADLSYADIVGANIGHAFLDGANLRRITSGPGDGPESYPPASLPIGWRFDKGALIGDPGQQCGDSWINRCKASGFPEGVTEGWVGSRYFGPKAFLVGLNPFGYVGIQLAHANLPGAFLEGANLQQANLQGANLSGAHLGDVSRMPDAAKTAVNSLVKKAITSLASKGAAKVFDAILGEAKALFNKKDGLKTSGGVDLRGANLQGADLSFADFTGANLSGADLTGANLDGTILTGADLSGVTMTASGPGHPANWYDGSSYAGVRSGSITATNPPGLPPNWKLVNGYLLGPGADLSSFPITKPTLKQVKAAVAEGMKTGGSFKYAFSQLGSTAKALFGGLTTGDFTSKGDGEVLTEWVGDTAAGYVGLGPDSAHVDLSGISTNDLAGVNLENADLSNSNFSGSNLTGVNLTGANLQGTDFTGAILTNAQMGSASADKVTLNRADLSGANLSGTTLRSAELAGVKSGGITGSPILSQEWKMVRGYLLGPGADARGAQLAQADLSGVFLPNADLTGADLAGANLTNTYLVDANLRGVRSGGIVGTPVLRTWCDPNKRGFECELSTWSLWHGYLVGPGVDLSGVDLST